MENESILVMKSFLVSNRDLINIFREGDSNELPTIV